MAQKLGDVAIGSTVKLKVNGTAREFLIVHQGLPSDLYDSSCEGTWLLMKDIYENRKWHSSNSNSYKASTIHSYLNSTFLNLFEANIRNAIKQVKIPYVNGTANASIAYGANGLSCKIFLLSCYELGLTRRDNQYFPTDGAKLSYFLSGTGSAANNKRIAYLNSSATRWWLRSPDTSGTGYVWYIGSSGDCYHYDCVGPGYIRPALVLPTDLFVDDDGNVFTSEPPSAPGGIEVTGVVKGQPATITLKAATDPDGTIASYVYERSVDGGAWTQFASVNSLTQTDTIGANWGTVAYRAKAVDDKGYGGPYVTSSTTVINSGWVIIYGPANDMGEKPGPFTFSAAPSISGVSTTSNISMSVALDGAVIYNKNVAAGTEVSIDMDTRTMKSGKHSITVAASCDSYLPASAEYVFSVPYIAIPDGGKLIQLESYDGKPLFPVTLARGTAGLDSYSTESKTHVGAYTGTGTYGSGNKTTLNFDFQPNIVIIQGTSGRTAVLTRPSGIGASIGSSGSAVLNVTWTEKGVSWYSAQTAANQMNTSKESYSYTAFG